MSTASEFDLASTPLRPGTTLLEASAGTGKTYTISGIVARLVAIEDIPLNEILVVTFTDAATIELRDRIRRRLVDVSKGLCADDAKDPALAAIRESGIPPELIRQRLSLALAAFDESSISTIHGFCQRLLRDNAFESDAPFEADVVSEAEEVVLELAYDFWYQELGKASPLAAALANHSGLTPLDLARLSGRLARHPDLVLLPTTSLRLSAAEHAVVATLANALAVWERDGHELTELLATHSGISRAKGKGLPAQRAAELAAELDHWSDTQRPNLQGIVALECLSAESIEALRLKGPKGKNNPLPHHEFFDLCSQFSKARRNWALALQGAWLKHAENELPRRKSARKIMTFDDMLTRTRKALAGPHGASLVRVLRRQYRAALIDEFQDTDPIQYEIFQRLFATPSHKLMLIGDPKQSIYGFRGADLFTYLGAQSERTYTLRTNYRSTAALVAAVNEVFAVTQDCFMRPDIRFAPAKADGKKAASESLRDSEQNELIPLVFVNVEMHDDQGAGSLKVVRQRISRDMAIEIERLLKTCRLGDRPLIAADIAILVRTHDEAQLAEAALREVGIPAVRRTQQSVFHSNEADELLRILEAVLEPSDLRLTRGALSAACFGLSATELHDLTNESNSNAELLATFVRLRETWFKYGFSTMFRELLVTAHLRKHLVSQIGGERKLTNLLHLGELSQEAEYRLKLAPEALVEWIREQSRADRVGAEEHIQRLEKDDEAVKIVTIHNAKGLEYPVVFCPSHWSAGSCREVLFHEAEPPYRLVLDLSDEPPEDHKARACEESLAEDVRLLYVALTRAAQRCYVYLHHHDESSQSPLGKVLGDHSVETARSLAVLHPENILIRSMHSSATRAGEASSTTSVAAGAGNTNLNERRLQRPVIYESMIGSFSRLVANAAEEEAQDYDATADASDSRAVELVAASNSTVPAIFRLPRGAATGIALHAVLEHADFRHPQSLAPLIDEHFAPLQLEDEFLLAVRRQLEILLDHPLHAEDHVVRLKNVAPNDRINEAEFYYPVRPFDARSLATVCNLPELEGSPQSIGRLHFSPIDGYLRGFMDLVFRHDGRYYLADWKSNWLGNSTVDYGPRSLTRSMSENFYHLQSWLYSLALDRFLAERLPDYSYERHFGGVFYIFVRGLDPAMPARGVHYARPTREFLKRLGEVVLEDAKILQ